MNFIPFGNTAPTFVGATTTLTVSQNASATDIKSLLHVSDTDAGQTETWSQSVAPNHGGTLNLSGATANSGSTNITPGGTITYTPANGYSGTETFTVQVSDGTASATRQITVTVKPLPTVTDARIGIGGASGSGGVFRVGDTVTATWDNTAGGDNNADTISGVTVDFSQFGGGAAVAATNSGDIWTASYTIVPGALNSVTNRNVAVTATNSAGSTTTSDTTNATVDNVVPVVSSVSVPADATHSAGQNLDFTVNWSENISGGTDSTLGLTIGSTSRTAAYLSQTASGITYRYTVQSGDLDSDGISVGTLTVNSSSIEDSAGNDGVLTLNSIGATTGVLVDGVAPTAAITFSPAGPYTIGTAVTITADFSEAVADSPVMQVAISAVTGGTPLPATNMTKVSATQYTYSHTVGSGNGTADVTLSTGRDLAGNLITATPTSGGSFTVSRSASTITLGSSANPANSGDSVTFTATVTSGATGTVDFKDGGTAITGCTAVAVSGTTAACTTSALTAGSHAITADYSGDDTYNASTSSTLTQEVRSSPTITSEADTSFTFGDAGSFTVTTTGYPAPALTRSGALPLGVTFVDNGNGTATISGTPNALGAFPITITATNGAGSVSQSFTLTIDAALTDVSAVDANIAVTPDRHLFGVETLGSCATSTPTSFTVRNIGATLLTLGTLTLGGTDAGEFAFGSDSCSGNGLAAGATCSAEVKFCPTTLGSKTATLLIPSDAPETPVIAAFLYNHESTREEASRRMPPVLERLNIPAVMSSGQQYTITWSLLGYDEDYLSRVAFFDCSGIPAGSCGNGFSSNFADSGNIPPVSTTTGDWAYNGVTSRRFDYSYTFTAPVVVSPTDIVIRFYRKSQSDNAAGKGSLSLLVPGNVLQPGTSYYDLDGRRLLHAIVP